MAELIRDSDWRQLDSRLSAALAGLPADGYRAGLVHIDGTMREMECLFAATGSDSGDRAVLIFSPTV